VTFAALELRNVAKVQRMLERAIAFVACGALVSVFVAEVYRVLERIVRGRKCLTAEALVERRVADAAVVDVFASVFC
jgi:hypothetical protein